MKTHREVAQVILEQRAIHAGDSSSRSPDGSCGRSEALKVLREFCGPFVGGRGGCCNESKERNGGE